ncbi:Thi4 family [Opitutaceae bacterium TAV1]|nr:Thi4 family [Opitutaceae bacterium TAV1]
MPTPFHFTEPARTLSLLDTADVLVLGAGPGGIGAAISAARNGVKVILAERFGCFGGTWTNGILSAIMPFPYVRGIFAEITARLQREAAWRSWNNHYGAGGQYDTETAKLVLDRMVKEAGIRPYFFTQAAAVIRDGSRLAGVIVESKEGRQVITARQFIDATGDGDVSVLAGADYAIGRDEDGASQPMSLIFKIGGIDDDALHAYRKTDRTCEQAWRRAKAAGEVTVPREDLLLFALPRPGTWAINGTRIVNKDATRVSDVTDAMIEGRRQAAEIVAFLRRHIPGCRDAVLIETAPHIGVRESRRIRCDYTITAEDILEVPEFEDCIARGNWFIDIHSPTGEGTRRLYPPDGKSYGIPWRSLRVRGLDNLLVASRCLDCTHEAHAAIRITAQIVAVGQAAGTAAALCVRHGHKSTRDLDPALLRSVLREQGAFLSASEPAALAAVG